MLFTPILHDGAYRTHVGLYRDAALTIWDEPTAPLDAKAEAAVYASLAQLRRERTVVLITHRLASAQTADCIHFLRAGRIVASSAHDDPALHAALLSAGLYPAFALLLTRVHEAMRQAENLA